MVKSIQHLQGKELQFDIRVLNEGPSADTRDIELRRDGAIIQVETLSVGSGEVETLTLTDSLDNSSIGDEYKYRIMTGNREPQVEVHIVGELDTDQQEVDVSDIEITEVSLDQSGSLSLTEANTDLGIAEQLDSRNNILYVNNKTSSVVPSGDISHVQFSAESFLNMRTNDEIHVIQT
jgi:hypothetical protein